MKKSLLALASALLLVAACDSASTDSTAGGTGSAVGNGTGTNGVLGTTADGTTVGDRVFFETDSSVVTGDGQTVLDRQAEWLKANASVNVVIEGHCDERGTREYNLALGERRATAVRNYLVSAGVPAGRVTTTSFGKERPAVEGHDESAWSQNRRAVTVIGG